MSIHYLEGDATKPAIEGAKILVHVCNDVGGWGKGFVMAISRKWKQPEREYRRWHKQESGFGLGEVQFVQVEPDLWVANMMPRRVFKIPSEPQPTRVHRTADVRSENGWSREEASDFLVQPSNYSIVWLRSACLR